MALRSFSAFAALAALLLTMGTASAAPSGLAGTIDTISAQTAKFRGLMGTLNQSQFHLVDEQTLLASSAGAAANAAIKKHASDIAGLRDTLMHTTMTGSDGVILSLPMMLKAQNVTVDQIIGIQVGSDNSVTLYYQ